MKLPIHLTDNAMGSGPLIEVDFCDPTEAESIAEESKALLDKGLLVKQIAAELSKRHYSVISRNLVTRAISHWHRSRGLPVPDGRSRRASLEVKSITPPLYQRIAPQVKQLADQGWLYADISAELKIDHTTVTSVLAWYHRQRGTEAPDGRATKSLARKSRSVGERSTAS
jgi:site-specific DNA recombinase